MANEVALSRVFATPMLARRRLVFNYPTTTSTHVSNALAPVPLGAYIVDLDTTAAQ